MEYKEESVIQTPKTKLENKAKPDRQENADFPTADKTEDKATTAQSTFDRLTERSDITQDKKEKEKSASPKTTPRKDHQNPMNKLKSASFYEKDNRDYSKKKQKPVTETISLDELKRQSKIQTVVHKNQRSTSADDLAVAKTRDTDCAFGISLKSRNTARALQDRDEMTDQASRNKQFSHKTFNLAAQMNENLKQRKFLSSTVDWKNISTLNPETRVCDGRHQCQGAEQGRQFLSKDVDKTDRMRSLSPNPDQRSTLSRSSKSPTRQQDDKRTLNFMRSQTQTFKRDSAGAFSIKSANGVKKNPLLQAITVAKGKNKSNFNCDNVLMDVEKNLKMIATDMKKVDKLIKKKEQDMAELKNKQRKILL